MIVTIKKKLEKPLKGGISNAIYIWRTEPGACEVCQELDGTEYNTVDDIPDRPHPNCKCYIDIQNVNEDNEDDMVVLSDENTQIKNRLDRNDNEDKIRIKRQDDLRILIEEAIGDCQNVKDEIDEIVRQLDKEVFQDDIKTIKDEINDKISELNDNNNELSNILNELFDLFYKVYNETEEEIREKINSAKDKISSIMKLTEEIFQETKNKIKKAREEFKRIKNNTIQEKIESRIGNNYGKWSNRLVKLFAGKDTAGMLDLSHGINMNDRSYIKDTISLDNYNDPKVAKDKEYLKDKVSKQFKDYNFDINKIKGYYFKSNSEPVQRLIANKDFQDMIKNHKDEIIQKGEFSAGFPKYGLGINWNNNFHNAIGKADFRNAYLDKDGNLHVKMYDTYDFNKNENNPLIKAGVNKMDKGELKPFFSIYDIIIPKDKLDEIWK